MATKKKTKKKPSKSKKAARKKPTPKKSVKRAKKPAKKKSAPAVAKKTKSSGKKVAQKKRKRLPARAFSPKGAGLRSGEQSGDLQGLSRHPEADSESVDELLEEGNTFEAEAVVGVESADNA